LSSGRVVDVAVAGPEKGTPLVFHHGTPGAALVFERFIEAVTKRGLRYVSYSRPGYGNSTRKADRTVAHCAADTAEVLDHLGADRFYTVGWSGGVPHALACGALLSQRVTGVAVVAGIAPWGADNLDWFAGMGRENVDEFNAALAGPDELRSFLDRAAPAFAQVSADQIIAAFGDLVDDVDKASLTGPLGAFLAESARDALRKGYWGWFDDDLAFTRNWGFDFSRINVPATVWHGGKDRMTPFAHGRWLAEHIPRARAYLLPKQGHLSLAVGSFDRIVDDLINNRKS